MISESNDTTSSRFLSGLLTKAIKSVRENGRIIANILCVVLFVVGVVDIIAVIVMTVQNADDKADALNQNVAIVVVIAGAVSVATALYIWHKLAGYASVFEVFARGQEDRDLIPSKNDLTSKVAMETSNV